jgi:hypothetical protein
MVVLDGFGIFKLGQNDKTKEKPVIKTFEVELTSVATVKATVIVDAIDEDNAKQIALTSCKDADFEIDTIYEIPTAEIVEK